MPMSEISCCERLRRFAVPLSILAFVQVACVSGDEAAAASLQEEPCELLTAAMVSETFGVPEEELDQTDAGVAGMQEFASCNYDWDSDGTTLEATVHTVRVFESSERALDYLMDTTEGMSEEEAAAARERVQARAEEEGELSEEEAEVIEQAAEGASRKREFRDVEGVGDRARVATKSTAIATTNADLRVVADNLYFEISAYHGPKAPEPDIAGLSTEQLTDPEAMKEIYMENNRKWMRETYERRVEQMKELARAVVSGL